MTKHEDIGLRYKVRFREKVKVENQKRIGILTGCGDCPGLNAAIRAVTKTAIQFGSEVIGIQNSWKGLSITKMRPWTGSRPQESLIEEEQFTDI